MPLKLKLEMLISHTVRFKDKAIRHTSGFTYWTSCIRHCNEQSFGLPRDCLAN